MGIDKMDSIDRLDSPTPELFRTEYLAKGRPVVIRGAAARWRAAEWTPEYFKHTFPGIKLMYETWAGDESTNDPLEFVRKQARSTETVQSFVEMMEATERASRKLYCAEWRVFEAIPQLRSDIESLEPYMGFLRALPSFVIRRLQLEPLLWMGPAGVISTLHFDRAHNFFIQLHGRKKWILVAPEHSDDVYYPCADFPLSQLHMSPVDAENPDLVRFPRYRYANPVEIVLEPGDALFIPAGHWHYVRALDTSVSMNFFWLKPLQTAMRLRKHIYYSLRRRVLERLRIEHMGPEVRVRKSA